MVCAGAAAGTLDACGGMNAVSVTTNSQLVNQNNVGSNLLASWTSQGCYGDNYPTVSVIFYNALHRTNFNAESALGSVNNFHSNDT
jgi:hypothetical protein